LSLSAAHHHITRHNTAQHHTTPHKREVSMRQHSNTPHPPQHQHKTYFPKNTLSGPSGTAPPLSAAPPDALRAEATAAAAAAAAADEPTPLTPLTPLRAETEGEGEGEGTGARAVVAAAAAAAVGAITALRGSFAAQSDAKYSFGRRMVSAAPPNTMPALATAHQHSTAQHSTAQHSTAQRRGVGGPTDRPWP
jgi:hypothetical protein